jgi:hypothetical protein
VVDVLLKLWIEKPTWRFIDHQNTQAIFGGNGVTEENAPHFKPFDASYEGIEYVIMPLIAGCHWYLVLANICTKTLIVIDPNIQSVQENIGR